MSSKISVIVPVAFGRLHNLNLTLAGLAAQTYRNFETILVNDGAEDALPVIENYADLKKTYIIAPKHDPLDGAIEKEIAPIMPPFDAPEEVVKAWQAEHANLTQKLVDRMMHMKSLVSLQPRNRGALNALTDFFVFIDSDVILHPRALEHYAEDFEEDPDRVVLGSYDWLHPMKINVMDVHKRCMDIIEERLPKLAIPQPQTHNIARDMRMKEFMEEAQYHAEHRRLRVWRGTVQERRNIYPKFLSCFSGNIGYPAKIFWDIGGYDNRMQVGIHEDGASGLSLLMKGHGISFDGRIRGGHVYHDRNLTRVRAAWFVEIPYINQRFKLDQYADDAGPRDSLPSLEVMSDRALIEWGVKEWQKEGGWHGFDDAKAPPKPTEEKANA